jgi:broad specificity phosphatase PhoE
MPDTDDHSPHLLVFADVWRRVEGVWDAVSRRAGDADCVLVVALGPVD